MSNADELITTLTTGTGHMDEGVLANDLLREFHRGYPVERLRPLLNSPNERVVKAAAFIASELGSKAAPLLDSLVGLLHYADGRVRSDAIISLITCTTGKHQKEIADVISMLDDPDWRIRHEVMEFMSRVSLEQLQAALRHFQNTEVNSAHVPTLNWVLSESGREPSQITAWLGNDSALARKYGVVAATRIASMNEGPLRVAAASEDDDVRRFADSMLQMRLASG